MRLLRSPVLLTLYFLAICSESHAEGYFSNKQTHLGGSYYSFGGGDKNKSFGPNTTGTGGEAAVVFSTVTFAVAGKVRTYYLTGADYFLDGTESRQLGYSAYGSEALLGMHLHLIPTKGPGFRPYIGGYAGGGIIQLKFADTTNTLAQAETSSTMGYEFVIGLELLTSKISLYAEFTMRKFGGRLAGQSNFRSDGIMLSGGFGW